MGAETDFVALRQAMIEGQLADRGIRDPRVLNAMLTVPRHLFVPQTERIYAYQDRPLPIGQNQTISQPYIVALMTELLLLQEGDKVLEIGTGSGYQATVLGQLAGEVHTIERHADLAALAESLLREIGADNVQVHIGDGSLGWPQSAPYDAILATASAPSAPQPLLEQLAVGGRLVLPVGGVRQQTLQRWVRNEDGFDHEDVTPVAFVPLIGEYGWSDT
jgi:protein-L-isoaspartate(D-aspartate) O-methyltransferase